MSEESSNFLHRDHNVLSAWKNQLAVAARIPSLSRFFAQRQDELFARFAKSYEELRALPRRARRALQRQLARSSRLTRIGNDSGHPQNRRALHHKLAWSLAGAALLLALGQEVRAADITVDTTKPDIAADGKCSMIEAIQSANANANVGDCVGVGGFGNDTIILPKGTHTLTQINNGVNGLPLITTNITIEGNGAKIARKKGPANFRLFQVNGGASLTLNFVTLTGGSSPGGGGAVFNNGGTLTIANSTISGNTSVYGGGGILNNFGNVTIQYSSVSKNTAYYGGGLFHYVGNFNLQDSKVEKNKVTYAGGGIYNSAGTFTITRSTISGNTATNNIELEVFGGGIDNEATLVVQDSIVTKNKASGPLDGGYGGGIGNFGIADITNSIISINSASSKDERAYGGGIANCGCAGASLTVTNSIITKNSAKTSSTYLYSYGGGINNYGTVAITKSTISLNKAELGGGIYNDNGTMTIENSTISGNKANLLGGGLFNDATMTVTNGTITKNGAKYGGGILNFYSSVLNLNRTLISGNKASKGGGPEVFDLSTVNANNFNLFGAKDDPGVVGFVPGINDVIPGPGVTSPKVVSPKLGDNGGPTPTHALVAGSPALDRVAGGVPATDQRGVARPQGPASDIGAFELEP